VVRARAIDLRVELSDPPVPVRGDASRLQQVSRTSCTNAATVLATGSASTSSSTASRNTQSRPSSDHGIGIEHAMLGKIFELFVQAGPAARSPARRARRRVVAGAQRRRAARRHDRGVLGRHRTRQSVRGAAAAPANAILQRGAAPRTRRRRFRVVVVEDQPDSREMLRVLLEKRKHIVIEARTGRTPSRRSIASTPTSRSVDIGLPVFNGYEVARQVRRRKHLDDVVLIALTGYGAPGDIAAAREAGFDTTSASPPSWAGSRSCSSRRRPARDRPE
jgi:CheY-like chemotaxis protein